MRTILAVVGGLVLLVWLLGQCGVNILVPTRLPVVAPAPQPAAGPGVQPTAAPATAALAQADPAPTQVTASGATGARQAADALLVGKPGAKVSIDGTAYMSLPVQPGENCDQVKSGVGTRKRWNVVLDEGVSVVIDAVTVNGHFDGSNPGVAYKRGPWSGTIDVLDGAMCFVPDEWFDWALKHRVDTLAGIRARYGLAPTPPQREL